MVSLPIRVTSALLAIAIALLAIPAHAAGLRQAAAVLEITDRVVRSQAWVEEWDPLARRWVRAGADLSRTVTAKSGSVVADARPLVSFGPFRVVDEKTAWLVGPTNANSPADFARMRAAFPRIQMLQMIDAPGTVHDIANLEVGRMIRAAGISTHVPANGSVRSGAVELFLAGKTCTMEPGALFAVHAWRDQRGRGPHDFAPDDPVNRLYTSYYEEMGMSPADARAFYDMTNATPHTQALWFGPEVMGGWIAKRDARISNLAPAPRLAYDPHLMMKPWSADDLWFTPRGGPVHSHQALLATLAATPAFGGI